MSAATFAGRASRDSVARLAAAALAAAMVTGVAAPPARAEGNEAAWLSQLTGFVASGYDSARGGFVSRKGSPLESSVELAWRKAGDGDALWRARARQTVDWTWTLFDSVGGGFLQGERDVRKDIPSFEKRTDSNSWRLENRVDAWLDGGAERDRRAVRQVLDYFDRILLDARGGFVAGQIGDREMMPAANGYAIRATLCWAAASGEPHWRDFAWKSIDRLWRENWNADFGFLRRGTFGEVSSVPRLDDQVEMGRALVFAAHVAGRAGDLEKARAVGDLLLEKFEDRKQGGMRWQVAVSKDGKIKNSARDPEPNARAARFLVELASVTGESRFRDAARRLVQAFVPGRTRPASDDADWALALRSIDRAELPKRTEWKEPPKPAPTSTPIRSRTRKK